MSPYLSHRFHALDYWNGDRDNKKVPYYHGDPEMFFHSRLPMVKDIPIGDYATTHQCLVDGRERRKKGSPMKPQRIKPTWVNPRTERSVAIPGKYYTQRMDIIEKAIKCLPEGVMIDNPGWTDLQLLQRLKISSMDNAHYRCFGKRGNLVTQLNELPHPQPKRLTYSTISNVAACAKNHGGQVNCLIIYGSSGRPMEDWRCRPMPIDIYNLGKFLWERNHEYLTDLSRVCPPNSCQVNFYYSRFKGHIRKHRDNGIRAMNGVTRNMSTPNRENSQLHGTNVMTFTIGASMEFTLHAFKDDMSGKNNAGMYTDTYGLTTTLDDCSCFVLDPIDNETHMHSARFNQTEKFLVRAALNYRWCVNEKWFYGNNHPQASLRWAYANHIEMDKKEIQWKFLLEGRECNYSKVEWYRCMVENRCSNQYYFDN